MSIMYHQFKELKRIWCVVDSEHPPLCTDVTSLFMIKVNGVKIYTQCCSHCGDVSVMHYVSSTLSLSHTHIFFVVLSLNGGSQLFEDKRLLGLSFYLWLETFDNILTSVHAHTHTHTHVEPHIYFHFKHYFSFFTHYISYKL